MEKTLGSTLDSLIDLVGFTDEDIAVLSENSSAIGGWVEDIVKEIFGDLDKMSSAKSVLKGNSRSTYEGVVKDFFSSVSTGDIGAELWEGQWSHGQSSVIMGTPVAFMPSVISRIQQRFLERCMKEFDTEQALKVFGAFKRATDVVAGLNVESYLDSFAEGVGITAGFSKALLERMAKLGAGKIRKDASG